jgi:hypothetical protein
LSANRRNGRLSDGYEPSTCIVHESASGMPLRKLRVLLLAVLVLLLVVLSAASRGGGPPPPGPGAKLLLDASETEISVPTKTAAPALTDSKPRQGVSLSVSNGEWAGNPVSYHYQWQDCNTAKTKCSDISGATISSYTPGAAEVGKPIRALVTARNQAGENFAASDISDAVQAVPPVNTVAPDLAPEAPRQGVLERATPGSWTNDPTVYSYQWQDCNAGGEECEDIAGATSSTYTPAAGDVGHMLEVVVTADNAGVLGSASNGNSGRLVLASSIESFYEPHAGAAFSAPGSVWNTVQLENTKLDPSSTRLVETLSSWGAHNMNGIDTTAYSSPIYTVPAGQPTTKVVLDWDHPPLNAALQSVPVPPGAIVADGTDETLVVFQPSSNQMWEFWHMREGLIAPVSSTLTATVSTGGKLAAGTYDYEVTALSAKGETTPSEPLVVAVPQSGSKVALSFRGVIYGQGYKVYRGTEPSTVGYVGVVHQATNEYGVTVHFTDDGAPATVAPPAVDTAATPGQWHAGWAGRLKDVTTDPGYYRLVSSLGGEVTEEPSWGATASSLPVADGMITLQDLEQGQIDHALQLLVPTARAGVHSYPAQRTDGGEVGSGSIPEGAHFVLGKSVNCNEQATPFMRMVCVAAQRYGFIVTDQTGGGLALRAEDPVPLMQTGGVNPYPSYFANGAGQQLQPYQMMAAFPWSKLHLLPMQLEGENEFHP